MHFTISADDNGHDAKSDLPSQMIDAGELVFEENVASSPFLSGYTINCPGGVRELVGLIYTAMLAFCVPAALPATACNDKDSQL